jgi:hypothetical protein
LSNCFAIKSNKLACFSLNNLALTLPHPRKNKKMKKYLLAFVFLAFTAVALTSCGSSRRTGCPAQAMLSRG